MSKTPLLEHEPLECQAKNLATTGETVNEQDLTVTFDEIMEVPIGESEPFSVTLLNRFVLEAPEGAAPTEDLEPNIKAALPDFEIFDLRCGLQQPLRPNSDVPFIVSVANYGSTNAKNVRLYIWFEHQALGYATVGIINGGTGINVQLDFNCPNAGVFQVKVMVNPNNEVPEIGGRNHVVSGNFQWGMPAGADICAYHIYMSKSTFPTMEKIACYVEVANIGDSPCGFFDFWVQIHNSTAAPSHFSCGGLGPMEKSRYDFDLEIKQANNYAIWLNIGPSPANQEQPDTDKFLKADFHVDYDTHFYEKVCRWPNPSKITINLNPEVESFITNEAKINLNTFKTYFMRWNGIAGFSITSNQFSNTKITSKTINDSNYTNIIRVFTYSPGDFGEDKTHDKAIAFVQLFSNTAIVSPIMWINKVKFLSINSQFTLEEAQKATIVHELGHALGLKHPFPGKQEELGCQDKAIMWQFKQRDYMSISLEGHDIYNLKMRYR